MECAKNWRAPLLISFDSNDRTKPKNMKTKITVLLVFAMFVVSVSAGTTKKGYVFSTSPMHVEELMSYIGKHDMAASPLRSPVNASPRTKSAQSREHHHLLSRFAL